MQYILSQEEMDANRQKLDGMRRLPTVEHLQEVCTKIADTMVLTEGWAAGRTWGCMLTARNYCDECPVQTICPHPGKRGSK